MRNCRKDFTRCLHSMISENHGRRGGILGSLLGEQSRAAFLLQPKTLAFDIDRTGMVEETVEDGGGQDLIAEHFTPVDKALVGSEDTTGHS